MDRLVSLVLPENGCFISKIYNLLFQSDFVMVEIGETFMFSILLCPFCRMHCLRFAQFDGALNCGSMDLFLAS